MDPHQILPRELAQNQKTYFREALRRSALAGRKYPIKCDWPPATPSPLIELYETWIKNYNDESQKHNHHNNNGNTENDVAWDPW